MKVQPQIPILSPKLWTSCYSRGQLGLPITLKPGAYYVTEPLLVLKNEGPGRMGDLSEHQSLTEAGFLLRSNKGLHPLLPQAPFSALLLLLPPIFIPERHTLINSTQGPGLDLSWL